MSTPIVASTVSLGTSVSLPAPVLVRVLTRVPTPLLDLLATAAPAMLGPLRFPLCLLGAEESTQCSEEPGQHPSPVQSRCHDLTESIEAFGIHGHPSEAAATR